jgi:hypothetical protein
MTLDEIRENRRIASGLVDTPERRTARLKMDGDGQYYVVGAAYTCPACGVRYVVPPLRWSDMGRSVHICTTA